MEPSVRFDLDGLWVGGGWGWPTSAQVERYPRAVDDDASGPRLAQLAETLRRSGFDVTGTVLKQVPKAYAADHPRAEPLRHRSMTAVRLVDDEAVLHSSAATDTVLETYDALRALIDWQIEHVAAAA